MGQQYLIDSNIVIDYLDGKLPAVPTAFMNNVVNNIPNISIITKIEVLGYNTPGDKYAILTGFVDAAVVFDLNEEIVNTTITIRKTCKIKTPDAIIAATALTFDLTLLTRNTNDFKNVPGLKVIDPYQLTG